MTNDNYREEFEAEVRDYAEANDIEDFSLALDGYADYIGVEGAYLAGRLRGEAEIENIQADLDSTTAQRDAAEVALKDVKIAVEMGRLIIQAQKEELEIANKTGRGLININGALENQITNHRQQLDDAITDVATNCRNSYIKEINNLKENLLAVEDINRNYKKQLEIEVNEMKALRVEKTNAINTLSEMLVMSEKELTHLRQQLEDRNEWIGSIRFYVDMARVHDDVNDADIKIIDNFMEATKDIGKEALKCQKE